MKYFTMLLLWLLPLSIYSQESIKLINAQSIDNKRYEGYKGSPFLWEENQLVTVYPTNASPVSNILGNYNLYTGQFEVTADGKYSILSAPTHPKIEYKDREGNITTLFYNIHPKLFDQYSILHYDSPDLKFIESQQKTSRVMAVNTPGETTEFKRFKVNKKFYIFKDARLINIKLKTKKIIKQFGHKKEIKKYLKENKLNIKQPKDMVQLIQYLDNKGWLK